MTNIPSEDASWRVGAVFRSCVRHHFPEDEARTALSLAIGADAAKRLATIWFRREPFFNSAEDYHTYRDGLGTDEELDELVAGRHPSVIDKARDAWAEYESHERLQRYLATHDVPDAGAIEQVLKAYAWDAATAAVDDFDDPTEMDYWKSTYYAEACESIDLLVGQDQVKALREAFRQEAHTAGRRRVSEELAETAPDGECPAP